MRSHPAQAAQVLETLPVSEAAALFEHAPARLGANVLSAMLPHRAALCVAAVSDARALELLAPMGTQPTVAVLRQLPESRRKQLISGLPTAAALASTLLLGYADDTLGAWADPDVVVLSTDSRAEQALERVRQVTSTYPMVFVVDGGRRLVGIVGLGALLHAAEGATLASLMHAPVNVLTAHAPLAGTPAHPGWESSSILPVLEPGKQLVGVMTRDALTRALRRTAPQSVANTGATSLPVLFAHGYWQALSGLLEGGLALLPKVPAQVDRATHPGADDGR